MLMRHGHALYVSRVIRGIHVQPHAQVQAHAYRVRRGTLIIAWSR